MAKTKTVELITIPALKIQKITLNIVGDTGLISHAWGLILLNEYNRPKTI